MTGPPYKHCKVPGCDKTIDQGCMYCGGHAEIAEIRTAPPDDSLGLPQDDVFLAVGISQLPLI